MFVVYYCVVDDRCNSVVFTAKPAILEDIPIQSNVRQFARYIINNVITLSAEAIHAMHIHATGISNKMPFHLPAKSRL